MKSINVLVLTGYGINCEQETSYVWSYLGCNSVIMHINDLIEKKETLHNYDILVIPGGFVYGDHISSGKILSLKLKNYLYDEIKKFISEGKLLIGICNGFQVLVKMGILPNIANNYDQEVTLTYNDSGIFEDRWVYLSINKSTHCVWLKDLDLLYLPVRHGEGKFLTKDIWVTEHIENNNLVGLRYHSLHSLEVPYPDNPNGSVNNIAGICDNTGRIFGLMPHPEAFYDIHLHPRWTREKVIESQMGVNIFKNGMDYIKNNS